MDEIFMYWYKLKGEKQNFGDVLGPYLVEKFSGRKVRYSLVQFNGVRLFLHCFSSVIRGDYTLKESYKLIASRNKKNILVSIGSIIEWYDIPNCDVWGAGIMNSDGNIKEANFYAVRGKYTQKRLIELGYQAPEALGDPALLLPLVYNPEIEQKFLLGIIPHYIHYEKTLKFVKRKDILVIDLLDDIEKVVRNIKSCKFIVSSSLHGVIVSHAYEIPCLWFNLPGDKLSGDNVKFLDYFSSLDIEEYSPYEFDNLNEIDLEQTIQTIEMNCNIELITKKIKSTQKALLKSAPFNVLSKYC